LAALTTLDLRANYYDTEGESQANECPREMRQRLEARFGSGLLLDGDADPHPLDALYKQFT
jgi:hypothetical protein